MSEQQQQQQQRQHSHNNNKNIQPLQQTEFMPSQLCNKANAKHVLFYKCIFFWPCRRNLGVKKRQMCSKKRGKN